MEKTWVNVPDVLFFQEGPGVRNTQYTSDGVKLLNVANLIDGNIDLSKSDRYISEEEAYGKYKHFLCDEGDFIVASSGIKVEYIDKKMGFVENTMLPLCMNTSTIRFKSLDQEKLRIRYFMYYLKSNHFKRQLFKQITGSAQLNYGPSHLKKMMVPLTDIEKQDRIIAELDRTQNIINKYEKELMLLDKLIKARFVELFGDIVLNPFNWEKDYLGVVCDVRDGTHDSPHYYETGFPLVTSKNVTGGKIDLMDCSLICEADFHKINERSKVDMGDIIMPMIGTVGKPVIVNVEPDFAIKNVSLIKFKDDSRVLNTFIRALLQSDYFDNVVLRKVRGGTQKFVSLGDIRKLVVIVPPMVLQERFADFVAQVDKSKAAVQKALDETQLLFDSLMQEYFG